MEVSDRRPVPAGRAPPGCNRVAGTGFSLVELLIVVLVLAVVAMAAIPTMGAALRDSRLSAAATEVVNAFEFARLSAMTSGRTTRVEIGADDDRITVRQYRTTADLFGGGDELDDTLVEGGGYDLMEYPQERGSKYEIGMGTRGRFTGVDIAASDFGKEDPVFFDALGAPSKGGDVTLVLARRQIVVQLGSMTGTVRVSE